MDNAEFTKALSQYLDADACDRLLDDGACESELPKAPLDNFFGDEVLSLLYRSKDPGSRTLRRTKAMLQVVSDSYAAHHLRAEAAVALGRFVQARQHDDFFSELGSSNSLQWYRLARQLNSVVGALAFANVILAQHGQHVEFNLDVDPLPRLKQDEKALTPMQTIRVGQELPQAWYLGARVAVRHVQRRFTGWRAEDFGCALACIVNYLTLLSAFRPEDLKLQVAQRRAALDWLKPLWNRLIQAAPEQARDPEQYHAALIEQQLAVLLRLDDLEQGRAELHAPRPTAMAAPANGDHIVVIKGEIPKSSDRGETDYLKQYEALRRPVGLTPLPDMETLAAIRKALEGEFPWAGEAISVVMSELIGRRRHGVMRLGFAPVLLVGPPGTGKTRFAQRLSDLFGTPNTVINMAGMCDVKVLKGVTRGWASNRPSRIVEFIQQTKVGNPLFILDEIDKTSCSNSNGGDPQEALLDLLEPGNARRYQDIYLMTECNVSHCLYIATSNSLAALSEPLLSRLRPVYFPPPGPEHAEVIVHGVLADMERAWGLPAGVLEVTPRQLANLQGLAPREMRCALLAMLGRDTEASSYTLH